MPSDRKKLIATAGQIICFLGLQEKEGSSSDEDEGTPAEKFPRESTG